MDTCEHGLPLAEGLNCVLCMLKKYREQHARDLIGAAGDDGSADAPPKYTVTSIDVLREARKVVQEGGDPNPCQHGTFCLRCCIAIAKGRCDVAVGVDSLQSVMNTFRALGRGAEPTKTDQPMFDARNMVTVYDGGIVHTQESALALLDLVLAEEAEHDSKRALAHG